MGTTEEFTQIDSLFFSMYLVYGEFSIFVIVTLYVFTHNRFSLVAFK